MKKSINTKKLMLRHETVKTLEDDALKLVAGGAATSRYPECPERTQNHTCLCP